MDQISISCSFCNKRFIRASGHVHESLKLGYKLYCSDTCHGNSKKRRIKLACENPICAKKFERLISGISSHNFCSSSCAAIVNNKKFPKHLGKRKICVTCHKEFISREKFCSVSCKIQGQIITQQEIIEQISDLYQQMGRIPLKREYHHARAARERFGSWNNAIKAAGYKPNPVMFARKHISNDGHKCDSLAEKIIDDWLYKRKINHKRSMEYPGNSLFTVDFVVGDYWIEFFGLSGEHKRYDELLKEKIELAKQYHLKLIQIYPHHLFPKNQLAQILPPIQK